MSTHNAPASTSTAHTSSSTTFSFDALPSSDDHVHSEVQAPRSGKPAKLKVIACVHCRKVAKRCSLQRPCPRCVKNNLCDSCVDAPILPRSKGYVRGHYKSKSPDGQLDRSQNSTKPSRAKGKQVSLTSEEIHQMASKCSSPNFVFSIMFISL